jgi:hypothetical protein
MIMEFMTKKNCYRDSLMKQDGTASKTRDGDFTCPPILGQLLKTSGKLGTLRKNIKQ